MRILRRQRRKSSINITSLIDVLFLLLIFFMISSTFKEQPGMKLELPESQTSESTELKDLVLTVDISDEGQVSYRLNTEQIDLAALAARFKEIGSQKEAPALTLKADRKVQHGTIVQLMDIAKQSNIKKLIIATRLPANQNQ